MWGSQKCIFGASSEAILAEVRLLKDCFNDLVKNGLGQEKKKKRMALMRLAVFKQTCEGLRAGVMSIYHSCVQPETTTKNPIYILIKYMTIKTKC